MFQSSVEKCPSPEFSKIHQESIIGEGQLPQDVNSFKSAHISLSKKYMRDPLAALVSTKLEEGDFKGAIHLASSGDTIVKYSEDSLSALRNKHLAPHADTHIPPPTIPFKFSSDCN